MPFPNREGNPGGNREAAPPRPAGRLHRLRRLAAGLAAGLALASAFGAASAAEARKLVVGYYPAWQWYDRANFVSPKTLPYGKLTHINYAFFKPKPDGTLEGTDSWADEILLKGEHDWANGGYKAGTSLIDAAHAHGVKVLVSIGGWTLSDLFPAIAADPALRASFAGACVKAIQDYGFDGIDIDWEYPGFAEHKGTPADKGNYTLLLKAVRARLDAHGATTGKRYLLTAALPAGPERVADLEVPQVAATLDFLNVMTYDFFGAWDPITGHNSPLYAQAQGDPAFSLDAAFRLYTRTHGVPAAKVNVGVAFYGRSFTGATTIYGPHSGADKATFSEDEGIPSYFNIQKAIAKGGWTRHWDDKAKVPYAVNDALKSLVGYDDVQSVGLKADYVNANGAAGVIVWELTGDHMDDHSTPLLDRLHASFGGGASGNGGTTLLLRAPAAGRGDSPDASSLWPVRALRRGGSAFDAAGRNLPVLDIRSLRGGKTR